eukprot:1392480-Amorphochlora_amoeboformis.AAC.1
MAYEYKHSPPGTTGFRGSGRARRPGNLICEEVVLGFIWELGLCDELRKFIRQRFMFSEGPLSPGRRARAYAIDCEMIEVYLQDNNKLQQVTVFNLNIKTPR